MMTRLIFMIFILLTPAAKAFELEAFAGANSITYDDDAEDNTYGVSARAKMNFYTNNHGIFVDINARGRSIVSSDLVVGYAWRGSGSWFLEAGIGGAYSEIDGPGVAVLAGFGLNVTSDIFMNFPLIVAYPGSFFWGPYVGFKF